MVRNKPPRGVPGRRFGSPAPVGQTHPVADPTATPPAEFPADFLWGAATSAYQVEGSPLADGAAPSIWYRFSHTPGRTIGGPVSDRACDHYRRWESDVELMRAMGLQSYRFSLAWSRLIPSGTGRANPGGLDFYSRLIDRLLERGITPMVTLYHWDLPAALEDRGGWLNPDSARWFADYAALAFRTWGDRVPLWATINEPWVIAHDGYVTGCNAPGHRNLFEVARVSHHLLCAHGAAVQAYRAACRDRIGLVVNLEPKVAASAKVADQSAQRRADAYFNRQYLDPVMLGHYPDEVVEMFGEAWPQFDPSDLGRIRQPIDFLGINYYTRKVVADDPSGWPDRVRPVRVPRAEHTETGWEVYPPALTEALVWVRDRYGNPPLYVTENGAAFPDPEHARGNRVSDPRRVHYLREHLRAAHAAMRGGVDLRGYYAWSLLDNVEWSSGTTRRFGLVHVDFESQRRTWKDSAHEYTRVIATRGASLFEGGSRSASGRGAAPRKAVKATASRPRARSAPPARRPSRAGPRGR
jgi:beta-glucosidase